MQFSILTFIPLLIAGTSAAVLEARACSAPFPQPNTFGSWSLCCTSLGPDAYSGGYKNCCDINGEGTGSGFPGC